MAEIRIEVAANQPPNNVPSTIGTLIIKINSCYYFTIQDFIVNPNDSNDVYSDPEGDDVKDLEIVNFHYAKFQKYENGDWVDITSAPFVITRDLLDSGFFRVCIDCNGDGIDKDVEFTLSDVGSQQFSSDTGLFDVSTDTCGFNSKSLDTWLSSYSADEVCSKDPNDTVDDVYFNSDHLDDNATLLVTSSSVDSNGCLSDADNSDYAPTGYYREIGYDIYYWDSDTCTLTKIDCN